MTFKDHFSARSATYAAHRPTYPAELASYLAGLPERPELALDVGCGSGQLSVLLAGPFERVVATDASASQVAAARPAPRVEYRVARAEASGMPDDSCDLVVAAQAAHWFDLPAFYAEARRVGRRGAAIALVTYGVLEVEPPIAEAVRHFYHDVAGPHWPPERRHVEAGYRTLDFPFAAIPAPSLAIRAAWTLDDLVGYAGTWSALKGAEAALGRSPLPAFRESLAEGWGDPSTRRPVIFPIALRAGRLHP